MTPDTLTPIILAFAALCLWQVYAGARKMWLAKRDPGAPMVKLFARAGFVQALLGALLFIVNIAFNWSTLKAGLL